MLTKDGTDSVVYVVDDDPDVRDGLKHLLESVGLRCVLFNSTAEFLQNKQVGAASCLISDVRLPGTGGLDFQKKVGRSAHQHSDHFYHWTWRHSHDGTGHKTWRG